MPVARHGAHHRQRRSGMGRLSHGAQWLRTIVAAKAGTESLRRRGGCRPSRQACSGVAALGAGTLSTRTEGTASDDADAAHQALHRGAALAMGRVLSPSLFISIGTDHGQKAAGGAKGDTSFRAAMQAPKTCPYRCIPSGHSSAASVRNCHQPEFRRCKCPFHLRKYCGCRRPHYLRRQFPSVSRGICYRQPKQARNYH